MGAIAKSTLGGNNGLEGRSEEERDERCRGEKKKVAGGSAKERGEQCD
jgi:hypothetical protein